MAILASATITPNASAILYGSFATGAGTTFNLLQPATITSARLLLCKSGTPTGNVTYEIYAYSGTPGTDAIPTGSPLATSSSIAATSLVNLTPTLQSLSFSNVYLPAGTYIIQARYSGGSFGNDVEMGFVTATPIAGRNMSGYQVSTSSWVPYNSGYNTSFEINGNYVFSASNSFDSNLALPADLTSYSSVFIGGWGAGYAGEQYGGLGSIPLISTIDITHTFDSSLYKQYTTQATIDSLLRKQVALTHTIDSLLKKQYTPAATIDSLLRKTVTLTNTIDSLIRATYDKTHTVDSLLRAQISATHSFDSFLLANIVNQRITTFDSLLKQVYSPVHTYDSLLKIQIQITNSVDSLLKLQQTLPVSFDSLLRKQVDTTLSIDSLLKAQYTRTQTFDSLLKARIDLSHSFNSLLNKRVQIANTIDSMLFKPVYMGFSFDSYLMARKPYSLYEDIAKQPTDYEDKTKGKNLYQDIPKGKNTYGVANKPKTQYNNVQKQGTKYKETS